MIVHMDHTSRMQQQNMFHLCRPDQQHHVPYSFLLPYQYALWERWLELVTELFQHILILPEKKTFLVKREKQRCPFLLLVHTKNKTNILFANAGG